MSDRLNPIRPWPIRLWAFRHPSIAAFICGIAATFTLPPFYLFPLIIPAYGGLYYLLNQAHNIQQAAKIGFFWGWGFYISGLYWFVIALMTEPDKFAWLIPFALFALTAVIALYQVIFAVLFFTIGTKHQALSTIFFTTLFTAIEYARGHLFTGFPWNLGGYVFAASDASIQLASVFGIYGLTFIAVFLGVIYCAHKRVAIISWVVIALAIGWGFWRATTAPQEYVEGVKFRLVQANIQQHHKWDPEQQMEGLRKHIALTQSSGIEDITHVIWPETAVPYRLQEGSTLAQRLGTILLPDQHLITGGLREEGDDIYNAISVIDDKGNIVGYYHKHKLVPFGEFLPLRSLIPDSLETPVGMRDLAPGPGKETLSWPGLPDVAPLICYEVIFPDLAVGGTSRPSWLLSVTNDAWFGNSTAPYQHLAAARMRAVEQGIPMVRVANTGITAVYDAYGRELVKIQLNKQGVADIALPEKSQFNTVYSQVFPQILPEH